MLTGNTTKDPRYADLTEALRCLVINLDLVSCVLQKAQEDGTAGDTGKSSSDRVHQMLGNLGETLAWFERRLDGHRRFSKASDYGYMNHLNGDDGDIKPLRKAVSLHNLEVGSLL